MTALTSRQRAALDLVASGALEHMISVGTTGHSLIPSQATEGAFYVTSEFDCTCPDYRYRGGVCKHMLARRLRNVLVAAEAERPININGRMPVAERED